MKKFIINNLNEITTKIEKKKQKNRIKYIEEPFILKNTI